MSFATEQLAHWQSVYTQIVQAELEFASGGSRRRARNFDPETVRAEITYWEGKVAAENAASSGVNSRRPLQVVI